MPKQDAKAVVAPKPTRPTKNYVEKNKERAAGQQSAKPGYTQKLARYKVEKVCQAVLHLFPVSFTCMF